jgi:starvation-inducible outer membrane lipoprotein
MQQHRHSHRQGDPIVQKPLTYALLLALALGLSACEKTPEDKMESAQENVSEAMESLGDAAEDTGEAMEKKVDQASDR